VEEAQAGFAAGAEPGVVDGGGDDETAVDEGEIEGRGDEVEDGLARRGVDRADGEVIFEVE
jgi:hypothetical protein